MESKSYVLITGASSGIGRHIAIKFSEKYNLILNGRFEEKLLNVLGECSTNDKHLCWIFDLNNFQEAEASLNSFIRSNGIEISGFIHCAGYLKMLPLKSISILHLQETMNINFNSAVMIIKSLISKKSNNAALHNVVFISSTASTMGAKAFNVYSASKGALDSLMRSLAVELAPVVRLNSVLPGGIQTKMTENLFNDKELSERMSKDYPLGLGEPNDIFEMVDFLFSERSKWITGQQFIVDGGRSINISA